MFSGTVDIYGQIILTALGGIKSGQLNVSEWLKQLGLDVSFTTYRSFKAVCEQWHIPENTENST